MSDNIICFGQQPCGFFPKRFLYSKITTARRLQQEIGGRIVFFFHDSDHDPRETTTLLKERHTGRIDRLNFVCQNACQKKYSPLYAKHIQNSWKLNTKRQLPNYVSQPLVELFSEIKAEKVADFCLEMYQGMDLLENMEIARSSDPELRQRAIDVEDFFVDVPYEGECVRARKADGKLLLHKGGDEYIELPDSHYSKSLISPTRDTRLRWMQSVVGCTHYIAGASEIKYMNTQETPEITFIERDYIDRLDEAYIGED